YAYSWAAFQVEPVAGVTPIAPMLAEMRRPIPPGFWPLQKKAPLPARPPADKRAATGGPPPRSTTSFDGAPGSYDVEAHAAQMAQRAGAGLDPSRPVVPAATPLLLAGMSD